MTDLPYALGCPSCRYYERVSDVDPDASLSELRNHLFDHHVGWGQPQAANLLLAKAVDLTEAQAAAR